MTGSPSAPGPGHDRPARRALARRRRRRKVRRGIAWGVLGGAILTLGLIAGRSWNAGLGWVRENTRLLQVRQVDVGPTRWVPPWEVVDASGVRPGDDILFMDPDSVAARITRHPRVVGAEVTRTWHRKVKLTVEEKAPVALWVDGGAMEVAADGTVLGSPPPGRKPEWPVKNPRDGWARGVELPLLTGVRGHGTRPGGVIDHPGARDALAFLARLRAYGKHGETWVSEVWAGEPRKLVAVTLEGGVPVWVGDGRLSRRKLDALQTVLERLGKDAGRVRFVDARFRNQVIVNTG